MKLSSALIVSLCLGTLFAPHLLRASDLCCEHIAAPLEAARFDRQLELVEPYVPKSASARDIDSAIRRIEKDDMRNSLFKIEGLTRIYEGVYGEGMKESRANLKVVEDLVGWYKDKVEFLAFAKSVGAPKSVLTAMEATRDQALTNLREYMPKFRGMIDGLKAQIRDTDWEKQAPDTKHALEQVSAEIKKREALDYDLTDLSNGIHEMRRNLRWILIYLQALDGMVLTEAGAGDLHEYSYLETHPIAQNKYSILPENPAIRKPIHIPLTYFLALSKLVEELGVIKSTGEHVRAIAQGYLDSGLARTQKEAEAKAEALASHDPAYVPDITAAATQVRDELARTGLLKRLRKALQPSTD